MLTFINPQVLLAWAHCHNNELNDLHPASSQPREQVLSSLCLAKQTCLIILPLELSYTAQSMKTKNWYISLQPVWFQFIFFFFFKYLTALHNQKLPFFLPPLPISCNSSKCNKYVLNLEKKKKSRLDCVTHYFEGKGFLLLLHCMKQI